MLNLLDIDFIEGFVGLHWARTTGLIIGGAWLLSFIPIRVIRHLQTRRARAADSVRTA